MTVIESINAALDYLDSAKRHLRLAEERRDPEQARIAKIDLAEAIRHAAEALRVIP